MIFRLATVADAPAVAALHAASWRTAYAGLLDPQWIATALDGNRAAVWAGRFRDPDPALRVILAEDGDGLAGFCSLYLGADPQWGSHVDNLHVRPGLKGAGLGRKLLAAAADLALPVAPGLDLYVYSANTAARAVYARLGGRETSEWEEDAPDGSRQMVWRVWWPDAGVLRP
jgi:ribosomal protein S18 acetylase RimI-like enzyme